MREEERRAGGGEVPLTLCCKLGHVWYSNECSNEVTLVSSLDHLHCLSTQDHLEAVGGGGGGGGGEEGEREREFTI